MTEHKKPGKIIYAQSDTVHVLPTSGNPTSTSMVKRLVRLRVCGNCCMQWSVKAAMTVLQSGQAFRLCKISATVHAQSRPIRLSNTGQLKISHNT